MAIRKHDPLDAPEGGRQVFAETWNADMARDLVQGEWPLESRAGALDSTVNRCETVRWRRTPDSRRR
jgi:hypothetical protein